MTPTRMRALVKERPGPGAALRLVPLPRPGPGEVLLRVKAASICGTDLHIYRWDSWAASHLRLPLIFGHEVCGEVVEAGPSADGELAPGALVSVETHLSCGRCHQCRTGQAHVCRRTAILGVDAAGTFAEYVSVPARNAWLSPPHLDPTLASAQEPLGNAVHAITCLDVAGRTVLVTGCGPIGLMAVAVARAFGSRRIVASEPVEYRRRLAARMGAHRTVDPGREDLQAAVAQETDDQGVDALLEMSGSPRALVEGLRAVRPGGSAALLGLQPGEAQLDLNELVILKGLTLYGITGRRMFDTWYRSRGLLEAGSVDLSGLVTHQFPLEAFEQAFATVEGGECGKVVLLP